MGTSQRRLHHDSEDALYGLNSQWVIENHGVEPDMAVDDSPADWMPGHDVQLGGGD